MGTRILTDQLTLSQPGVGIMPKILLIAPLNFLTFLWPCSFSPDGDLATQERWMRDLAEDFGNFGKILGWYRGPRPVIYATNPDFLKEVFIKESETYIDRPMLDRSDNVPHLIMLKGNNLLSNMYPQFFS